MKGILYFITVTLVFVALNAHLMSAQANTIKMTASLSTKSVSHISEIQKSAEQKAGHAQYLLAGDQDAAVSISVDYQNHSSRQDISYNQQGLLELMVEAPQREYSGQPIITVEHH